MKISDTSFLAKKEIDVSSFPGEIQGDLVHK